VFDDRCHWCAPGLRAGNQERPQCIRVARFPCTRRVAVPGSGGWSYLGCHVAVTWCQAVSIVCIVFEVSLFTKSSDPLPPGLLRTRSGCSPCVCHSHTDLQACDMADTRHQSGRQLMASSTYCVFFFVEVDRPHMWYSSSIVTVRNHDKVKTQRRRLLLQARSITVKI
jgi:hypothetical protein